MGFARCVSIKLRGGFIMAEFNVQFDNKAIGYNKKQVNQFVKDAEAMLQERAAEMAKLQQQIVDLEARLSKITGDDTSVEEKVELYDKLMKKMDGDYNNILKPAIAKAKAIEEKAQAEYEVRMDQARATADGIYAETADRIAAVVDGNMDRIYDLIDQFLYSKTLPGRIEAFIADCKMVSEKITDGLSVLAELPKKGYNKAKDTYADVKAVVQAKIQEKMQAKIDAYKAAVEAAKAAVEEE